MNTKILIATNNVNKLIEIKKIFTGYQIESLEQAGLNIEVEEKGKTFFENALIKAKTISEITGKITLADDSGLIVDALGGRPGIHSARYAGPNADSASNRSKLLNEMQGISNRTARFHATIVLYFPNGEVLSSEGDLEGEISLHEKGKNGFGYDSIFYLKELGLTLAEVSMKKKNSISHRRIALQKLKEILQTRQKV